MVGKDKVLAFAEENGDFKHVAAQTSSRLRSLEERLKGSSGRPDVAVACYSSEELGPSIAPEAISMLYAMAPYDIARDIVLFSPDTVGYAEPLIELGAVKVADMSGTAGWAHCVFDAGDFEVSRLRESGALYAYEFSYRGELTARNTSNLAMRSWSALTEEISWFLHGGMAPQPYAKCARLSDSMALMSYGLEKELPLDKDHLLPICDFRLEVVGDDPARFSMYRYKRGQTERILDVYEIFKAYCDENSIRPFIHKAGFAANKEEMERIDEMTGVKSALEAYYSGADKTYILAGMLGRVAVSWCGRVRGAC